MDITISSILIFVATFFGLFVSIFYLLTTFSPNKKEFSKKIKYYPKITIVIPVWNEGSANGERIRKTISSLFNADYPKDKLEIIIVDDGSTDNSLKIAKEYISKGVRVLSNKKSLGKTLAVNKGMKFATGELVAALDADSFIMPDVLKKMIPAFNNPNVMAAIPSIKIWKPKSLLQKIQFVEFLSAVFVRHLQSQLGAVHLAPGAFTLVRKSFLDKYGRLDYKTMVEDLELSLRIQSHNYLIETIVDANVYTSGVKTFKAFERQRLRWFIGFLMQIWDYRRLFNKKYGNLGVFILPISVFFVVLSLVLFVFTVLKSTVDGINLIRDYLLSGINLHTLLEWKFDFFFITISNKTLIPVLLLIITFLFMYYVKKISNEKQHLFWNLILFTFTYWVLGPYCWVKAIIYKVFKIKVKWGPNYFLR